MAEPPRYTHGQPVTWRGRPGYLVYLPPAADRLAVVEVERPGRRPERVKVRLDSPDLEPAEGRK